MSLIEEDKESFISELKNIVPEISKAIKQMEDLGKDTEETVEKLKEFNLPSEMLSKIPAAKEIEASLAKAHMVAALASIKYFLFAMGQLVEKMKEKEKELRKMTSSGSQEKTE